MSCSVRTRATRAGCCSATGSRRGFSRTTTTTRPRARPSCFHGFKREGAARVFPTRARTACTVELLPRLQAGERIALLSDAGMPGVSDPGARLVRAALDAAVQVVVLPGASAVETALVASGFAGERVQFLGFLPRGGAALTS